MILRSYHNTLTWCSLRNFIKANLSNQSCSYCSALYMSGDKAKSNFSFISPHLDFEHRFKEISELEKNVALRGIPLNIKSLKRMWDFQEGVRANKNQLEGKRLELAKTIKDMISKGTDDGEIEKLKILAQKVKREIKVVTSSLWDLENKVMPKLLSLPNVLHTRTPVKTEKVLHTYLDYPRGKQALSHVDIGNSLGVLKVIGPLCYFLKNEGVKFEMGLIQYFVNYLRSKGFVQFSNPDFVKSLVVEGCGFDHKDPLISFILKRDNTDDIDENNPNRLHLTGGASFSPFCSYFAKHLLNHHHLPVKLFASGRSYSPSAIQLNGSLIKSCQASAVQLFVALSNSSSVEDGMFDDLLADLINAYENLGYHFKVSYLPPSKLNSWECLRASFQMYSSFSQTYVEVGNLSMCSDFVSKRLLMYYQNDKSVDFMRLVTGTVISVPKMLACVLEDTKNHYDGKLLLPLPVESNFYRRKT